VQFDEKWAFVGKKQKNCDPDDARRGDCWDHVALDPETRLVVSLVVGKRTAEATRALVRDFRRRTGGRVVRLMTSDEYPAYAEAIREAYGHVVVPPRTGRPGRPRKAYTAAAPGVTYATVHKEKEIGHTQLHFLEGDIAVRRGSSVPRRGRSPSWRRTNSPRT
jgi:IS1 family transposase